MCQVEPRLLHHAHHFRVHMLGGLRSCRDGSCPPRIGQRVEERRRHLRPPSVVHAGEDHGGHRARSRIREATSTSDGMPHLLTTVWWMTDQLSRSREDDRSIARHPPTSVGESACSRAARPMTSRPLGVRPCVALTRQSSPPGASTRRASARTAVMSSPLISSRTYVNPNPPNPPSAPCTSR